MIFGNAHSGKNFRLCVRTDGNGQIGTGHIGRCLSIALAARDLGAEIIFAGADGATAEILSSRGEKCLVLDSVWNDLEMRMEKEFSQISGLKPDAILCDSYYATRSYLNGLQAIAPTTYVDDFIEEPRQISRIIHYSAFSDDWAALNALYPKDSSVDLLIGAKYVPLRSEFSAIKPHRELQSIEKPEFLLLTGGTDNHNVLGAVLDAFVQKGVANNFSVRGIVGVCNANWRSLCENFMDAEGVTLLRDVKDMWRHMEECDAAVTAGGTTLYELCAARTPFAVYSLADNQTGQAESMHSQGLTVYLGEARNGVRELGERIVDWMAHAAHDRGELERLRCRIAEYGIGSGSMRIAEKIMGMR